MTSPSERGVAAVVGVGAGLGAALARRFAAGYKVALVARSGDVIGQAADEIRAGAGPVVRSFWPDAMDEDLLKPSAIADAFWYLAH